jgi:hypothetical protein
MPAARRALLIDLARGVPTRRRCRARVALDEPPCPVAATEEEPLSLLARRASRVPPLVAILGGLTFLATFLLVHH